MFTIEQIADAHKKVKTGADFPAYIAALKSLGVAFFTTWVEDGRTEYRAADDKNLISAAEYERLPIAGLSDKELFVYRLRLHQQGGTDYPTFCSDAATSGVEKWVVDLVQMTCTYYDQSGEEVWVEQIPE